VKTISRSLILGFHTGSGGFSPSHSDRMKLPQRQKGTFEISPDGRQLLVIEYQPGLPKKAGLTQKNTNTLKGDYRKSNFR